MDCVTHFQEGGCQGKLSGTSLKSWDGKATKAKLALPASGFLA